MAELITKIYLSKKDASAQILSQEYLYKTRNEQDGPIRQIIEWLETETGNKKSFNKNDVKIGNSMDKYAVLYYKSGMLYIINKDGTARISGADADNTFPYVEKDMQRMIDSIIAKEISKKIIAEAQQNKINVAKTKQLRGQDKEPIPCMLIGMF